MAQRRMFSRKITETDLFLDMPMSAQCLYFHLNMSADDDGFIGNAKTIRRMIGASEDDLKILLAKEFLIPFESGVVVVKDWKIHNYIRSDRYNETQYLDEKKQLKQRENGSYEIGMTSGIPTVDQRDTQVRLGKDRLGKVREDKPSKADALNEEFDEWWDLYGKKGNRKPALQKFKTCRKSHSFDQIINGTKEYLKTVTDKKFQKHGSTFLNAEGYMDDYTQDANYNVGASNEVASMEEELGLKTEPTREFTQEEIEEFNREELSF